MTAWEPSWLQLTEIKGFIDIYKVETFPIDSGTSDQLAASTNIKLKALESLETSPKTDLTCLENPDDFSRIAWKALERMSYEEKVYLSLSCSSPAGVNHLPN